MSAFRFYKIVDCFLHSYYRHLLFNGSAVTIFMAESSENTCSDIFLYEYIDFIFHQKGKVHPLLNLWSGNAHLHWHP